MIQFEKHANRTSFLSILSLFLYHVLSNGEFVARHTGELCRLGQLETSIVSRLAPASPCHTSVHARNAYTANGDGVKRRVHIYLQTANNTRISQFKIYCYDYGCVWQLESYPGIRFCCSANVVCRIRMWKCEWQALGVCRVRCASEI